MTVHVQMDDDTVMVSSHDVDGDDSALSQSLNFADFDAFPASPPTAHEAAKVKLPSPCTCCLHVRALCFQA